MAELVRRPELDYVMLREIDDRMRLDVDFDYSVVNSLRKEAVQKLNMYKPMSIGQASRISGVSPADISVLLVYLEQKRHMRVYTEGNETI